MPLLVHERRVLLLAVGHARWQRPQMPVDVRIALMAPDAQHVEPLGRYRG